MNRQGLSDTRKRIRSLQQAMADHLEVFLKRTPLLRGQLYKTQTRCGKPGCRCNRGELHSATVLAYRGGKKQYNRCPASEDIDLLRRMTLQYQDFRQARAGLIKTFRELLRQIGVMEQGRLALGESKFRKTATGRKTPEKESV